MLQNELFANPPEILLVLLLRETNPIYETVVLDYFANLIKPSACIETELTKCKF